MTTSTTEPFEAEVLAFIRKIKGRTFAEVMNHFPKEVGEFSIGVGFPNLVLWCGMSERLSDALHALAKRGAIKWRHAPDAWLCHMIDGGTLNMPLLKRAPKKNPAKPYWLPVFIDAADGDPK